MSRPLPRSGRVRMAGNGGQPLGRKSSREGFPRVQIAGLRRLRPPNSPSGLRSAGLGHVTVIPRRRPGVFRNEMRFSPLFAR